MSAWDQKGCCNVPILLDLLDRSIGLKTSPSQIAGVYRAVPFNFFPAMASGE
jgi:hypothetical protein